MSGTVDSYSTAIWSLWLAGLGSF